jgi:hypothetical protein
VKHLSKCQVDQLALEQFCIAAWTGALQPGDGTPSFLIQDPSGGHWIQPHERLYIDAKVLPEDTIAAAMNAYVMKQSEGYLRAGLRALAARNSKAFEQTRQEQVAAADTFASEVRMGKTITVAAAQLGSMARYTPAALSTLGQKRLTSALSDKNTGDNLEALKTMAQALVSIPTVNKNRQGKPRDPMQQRFDDFIRVTAPPPDDEEDEGPQEEDDG